MAHLKEIYEEHPEMFERRKQHKHQASGKAALMHSSSRIAAVQKATRQRQPRTSSCGASEANGETLKRWRLSRLKTLALAFSPSIRRCTWLPGGVRHKSTWHLRHESGEILLIGRASLEASNAQHTRLPKPIPSTCLLTRQVETCKRLVTLKHPPPKPPPGKI